MFIRLFFGNIGHLRDGARLVDEFHTKYVPQFCRQSTFLIEIFERNEKDVWVFLTLRRPLRQSWRLGVFSGSYGLALAANSKR